MFELLKKYQVQSNLVVPFERWPALGGLIAHHVLSPTVASAET